MPDPVEADADMVADDATDSTGVLPHTIVPEAFVVSIPQLVDDAKVVVPFIKIPLRNVSRALHDAAKVTSSEEV